jgi:hypothetical protein
VTAAVPHENTCIKKGKSLMPNISWNNIFPGEIPGNGATEAELQAFVSALGEPLSNEEVQTANDSLTKSSPVTNQGQASHKPFDARKWRLPAKPLPPSYLSFLHWSNGGSFYNGARGLNFLSTSTLREFALSYCFPEYMSGSLPFAFDGGDNFYLFDMRSDPVEGEYPILFVRAENLSYADAVRVANSFVEACEGKTDPVDLFKT